MKYSALKLTMTAVSILLLAGCSSTSVATNTNLNVNTNVNNVANENSNTNVVVNENTNLTVGEGVDTSDWLTYTSDEYGFSLQYPAGWSVDVIDENDEGGIGLSLGSIVMTSKSCRAQGDLLREGTIEATKKDYSIDASKNLVEINQNSVSGIRYYDVVNENGYKGDIYMYLIAKNEFSFRVVDNANDNDCQTTLNEIMKTLEVNS